MINEKEQERKRKEYISGAGLIFMRHGKILLVKTCLGNKLWGPPKGQVEKNESHWECMLREVDEETGYDLTGLIFENTTNSMVIRYTSGFNYLFYIVQNDSIILPEKKPIKSINEVSCAKWFDIKYGFDKNIFQRITRECIKSLKHKWITFNYNYYKSFVIINCNNNDHLYCTKKELNNTSCSREFKKNNIFEDLNMDVEA